MARPLKKILLSDGQIRKLAEMHCTDLEIASLSGVDSDTIARRFGKIIAKGRDEGKKRLRRLQWEAATKGNVVMQIWLGKQLLGQRDSFDHNISSITVNTDVKKLSTDTLEKIREALDKEKNGEKPCAVS
jgi:hypothetical protein